MVLQDDHVLLHRLEGDDFWALPGGRVNTGEQARLALVREFQEELSLTIECGHLLCVGENFFTHQGESYHEVGLYFSATLPQGAPINDRTRTHYGSEQGRVLEFRWFRLAELDRVDLRPVAIREGLRAGKLPAHFVDGDMVDSDLERTIAANAAEIARLHSRVQEAWRHRGSSESAVEQWRAACAEFAARYDALAFPGGYSRGLAGIAAGEAAAIDTALCFLELRPYFFRSGYMYQVLLRKVKRAALSPTQRARLEAVIERQAKWRALKASRAAG